MTSEFQSDDVEVKSGEIWWERAYPDNSDLCLLIREVEGDEVEWIDSNYDAGWMTIAELQNEYIFKGDERK